MFITIAIIVAAIIAAVVVVLILASTKPGTFRVQRSAIIKAAPDKIFPRINDFHNWGIWSPWEKLDPGMMKTYSGNERGKGAIYEWTGNGKVGAGRMEIIESSPPGKVTIKLDFLKPFEAHNTAEFTILPKGDSTEITWAMQGPAPFMARIFHVFVNMDRLIGKEFEAGLAGLKAVAET